MLKLSQVLGLVRLFNLLVPRSNYCILFREATTLILFCNPCWEPMPGRRKRVNPTVKRTLNPST